MAGVGEVVGQNGEKNKKKMKAKIEKMQTNVTEQQ